MTKKFSIKKICTEENRPPYSYKIDEYFENFVSDNILTPLNIMLEDEWKTILSIMIFKKDEQSPEGVSFYEADILEDEKVTIYPVSIYLEDIYANNRPVENIVSLYFQIISLFFLSKYKNVSQEYMLGLKEKLDWDYLLFLPYPAPVHQQNYVGDNG